MKKKNAGTFSNVKLLLSLSVFYKTRQLTRPNNVTDVVLVSLMLTLNGFYSLFWFFYCWCQLRRIQDFVFSGQMDWKIGARSARIKSYWNTVITAILLHYSWKNLNHFILDCFCVLFFINVIYKHHIWK